MLRLHLTFNFTDYLFKGNYLGQGEFSGSF